MQNKGAVAIVLLSIVILVGIFSTIYFWLKQPAGPDRETGSDTAVSSEQRVQNAIEKITLSNPESFWYVQEIVDMGEAARGPLLARVDAGNPETEWAVVVGLNAIRRSSKDQAEITEAMKKLYRSQTSAIRIYAAAGNAEQGDYSGLPILLDALAGDQIMLFIEPPRPEGSFANRVLEFVSGQDFGYDEAPDIVARDQTIQQWKEWANIN